VSVDYTPEVGEAVTTTASILVFAAGLRGSRVGAIHGGHPIYAEPDERHEQVVQRWQAEVERFGKVEHLQAELERLRAENSHLRRTATT
jgi:hypothetical protein